MKAVNSLDLHRQMMQKTKYTKLPKYDGPVVQARSLFSLLFDRQQLAEAFRLDSDHRDGIKQNPVKPIHAHGVSGVVRWEARPDVKYTGIFWSGGVGVVRFSTAVPYAKGGNFIPGMALKIFVDGAPSANFHAMPGLDGQGDDPFFFRNTFRTSIEPPVGFLVKQLAKSFRSALERVSPWPSQRPVSERTIPLIEAATVTSDGLIVTQPDTPTSISFIPAVPSPKDGEWDADEDFRDNLQKYVQTGTKLFDIVDQDGTLIGELNLLEPLIASKHGDEMFFKHQRVSE